MKSTAEKTRSLLAVIVMGIVMGMVTVPLTKAQAPVSAERRRAEGLDRKSGESADSISGTGDTGPVRESAGDESMRLDEFESRRAQLTNDLDYLKAAAVSLARASRAEDPDLKSIAVQMGEIRKRAKRLLSELALPRSEPKDVIKELELPIDRPQLKLSIYALSVLITDAVKNPLPAGRVLYVVESLKARNDLDAIVELSGRIRMQCDLLGKSEP